MAAEAVGLAAEAEAVALLSSMSMACSRFAIIGCKAAQAATVAGAALVARDAAAASAPRVPSATALTARSHAVAAGRFKVAMAAWVGMAGRVAPAAAEVMAPAGQAM